MMEKYCKRCDQTLPVEMFGRNRNTKSGYQSYCKKCRGEYDKKNPQKPYSLDEQRAKQLWTHYKLTPEQYDTILYEEQGGRCATCPAEPKEGEPRFAVDHDHNCCFGRGSCGACIRGILCRNCNLAIGNAKESPEQLEKLAAYIRQYVI